MRQTKLSLSKLRKMGVEYGLDNNPLFASLCQQYMLQQEVIDRIRTVVMASPEEDLTVSQKYGKEGKNVVSNPLIREIPKHCDSANKTMGAIVDIIVKLGNTEKSEKTLLSELMNDD